MSGVSGYEKLYDELRITLRDTGLQFTDALLSEVIGEAQREYSLMSGELIARSPIRAGKGGVCAVPADFIYPVKFIGTDGQEKPFYSWRYLNDQYGDFRKVCGSELRGVIFDFESFGKMRLFPQLPEGTEAGTLYYARLAKADELEVNDLEAVKDHALFQMFLLSGNNAAGEYYDRFVNRLNEGAVRKRNLRSAVRRGRFY